VRPFLFNDAPGEDDLSHAVIHGSAEWQIGTPSARTPGPLLRQTPMGPPGRALQRTATLQWAVDMQDPGSEHKREAVVAV
jgi:hypothetical protein